MPATGGVPRSAHCGRPLHLARGFARSRAILVSAASCSPLEVSSQSGTSESLCGNWLVCEKAVLLTDFAGKKHGDRVAFSAPTHEARRSANAVSPIRHSRPLRISVRSDQYPIDPLGAFMVQLVKTASPITFVRRDILSRKDQKIGYRVCDFTQPSVLSLRMDLPCFALLALSGSDVGTR